MSHRLPIYFLLDCSESMIGPGIESLSQAVDGMLRELRRNPQALETAWISFLTFAGKAEQQTPLTALEDVQPPRLKIAPGTALAAAVQLTADAISREVKRSTPLQKGDWKALVFIITDGCATDDCRRIGSLFDPKSCNVYAIGCGADVDYHQLGQITPNVLKIDEVTPQNFARLFQWLSISVQSASVGIAENEADRLLTNLPAQVSKICLTKEPRHDGKVRSVFLRIQCSNGAKPYLMRFNTKPNGGGFLAASTHILDSEITVGETNDFPLPSVNAALLEGSVPCPYCKAASWWCCGKCQALNCLSLPWPPSVTCPSCKITGQLTQREFSVKQRAG